MFLFSYFLNYVYFSAQQAAVAKVLEKPFAISYHFLFDTSMPNKKPMLKLMIIGTHCKLPMLNDRFLCIPLNHDAPSNKK
jgi:hypothetical protein